LCNSFLLDFQEVAVKIHWLYGTAALIAAMLACNVPSAEETDSIAYTKIHSVAVSPPSGIGNFEILVTYKAFIVNDQPPDVINCFYIAPSGMTISFGAITPSVPDTQYGTEVTLSGSLPFSVQQADGNKEVGTYQGGCLTEKNSYIVNTYFTVTEAATPTPTLESGATVTSTPTFTLSGGTISYDEASEQLSPRKNPTGYFPSQHHKWCAITLNIGIDAAGNIRGTCAAEGHDIASGLYGDWNGDATIEGTITGKAVPGGSFTFREELIEKYKPGDPNWESIRKVVFEGTGSFVSPTRATGTATISAECLTVDNTSTLCGDEYSAADSFTGTINWEFNGTGVTWETDNGNPLRPRISQKWSDLPILAMMTVHKPHQLVVVA
jgi:hypothetical protein